MNFVVDIYLKVWYDIIQNICSGICKKKVRPTKATKWVARKVRPTKATKWVTKIVMKTHNYKDEQTPNPPLFVVYHKILKKSRRCYKKMEKIFRCLELKNYLDTKRFDTFIFSTENQGINEYSLITRAELSFKEVIIDTKAPNGIVFKNESGYLKFRNIKKVSIEEGKSVLGTILTVTCRGVKMRERRYIFICR